MYYGTADCEKLQEMVIMSYISRQIFKASKKLSYIKVIKYVSTVVPGQLKNILTHFMT